MSLPPHLSMLNTLGMIILIGSAFIPNLEVQYQLCIAIIGFIMIICVSVLKEQLDDIRSMQTIEMREGRDGGLVKGEGGQLRIGNIMDMNPVRIK